MSHRQQAELGFSAVHLVDPPDLYKNEEGWRWETVIPGFYNLWYALEGRGHLQCDGLHYSVAPGSVFLFAPGQRVAASHDPEKPVRNFAAHFLPADARGVPRESAVCPALAGARIRSTSWFTETIRMLMDCWREGNALARRQANGLVYQLLLAAVRDARRCDGACSDERMQGVVTSLLESPGHWRSVAEMARCAGCSPAHFSRRFRTLTGKSPNRFLVERRIERAGRLLTDSPLRIGEIAEALGYADVYFFSRQFRKETGLTPTAWRRRNRGSQCINAASLDEASRSFPLDG
jgi:AraC family transcriptional regulator, arabinose operon regulatory protein